MVSTVPFGPILFVYDQFPPCLVTCSMTVAPSGPASPWVQAYTWEKLKETNKHINKQTNTEVKHNMIIEEVNADTRLFKL